MESMMDILIAQEEACVFNSFDAETAWRIGCTLREAVKSEKLGTLIDVTVGGVRLFRSTLAQPTPHNQTWIPRKRNTVLEFWKSSCRVGLEMKLSGKTLASRGLCEEDFALCGGGFPIRVRNIGVIGAIVCSGLADTHDHQLVVDAVAKELNVTVDSIL